MDAHINELLLDLEEIKKFEGTAQRESVRGKLAIWRSQIEQELSERKQKPVETTTETSKSPPKPKLFTKKLSTYAWDQSNKFVKIFVSGLKGVKDIPEERVSLTHNGHHYILFVANLNNSNYQFNVPKLLHEVKDTTLKIKSDEIVIMLTKSESGVNWETLSEMEKKGKDEKKRKDETNFASNPNEDPSAGIMNMMRKMYEEGDDDMKRTIAKAWTESRDKQMSGDPGI